MQAVDETEHSFIATHTGMPNYQQKNLTKISKNHFDW